MTDRPGGGRRGIDGIDADVVPPALRAAAGWSWRLLAIGAAGYALLRVLAEFRLLIVPLLISLLLVALVRPVTDALAGLRVGPVRVPRALAAALTVLLSLAVLAGLIALIGQQIATGFPSLRVQAADGLQDLQRTLASSPLHLTSGRLSSYLNTITERLRANSGQVVSGAVQVTTTAVDVGAGALLVLFSMFFLLSGGDRIWAWLVGLFPRRARARVDGAGLLAWGTLTAFVRATVVVAAVDGIGVAVVARLLGVPLPIPLGVLVFLGAFVPIVGSLVSGSVAVLIAFVADGPVLALAMLAGVLGVAQLEGHVLQPFLLGRAVRVHPLAVILVITAGALLAGIPGALFAVPVTAVANVVTAYLVRTSGHRDPGAAADPVPADPVPAGPVLPGTALPAAVPADPVPPGTAPPATVPAEPVPAEPVRVEALPAEQVPAEPVPSRPGTPSPVPAESLPAANASPGRATVDLTDAADAVPPGRPGPSD